MLGDQPFCLTKYLSSYFTSNINIPVFLEYFHNISISNNHQESYVINKCPFHFNAKIIDYADAEDTFFVM